MSADNGIYVLETISRDDPSKKEWRMLETTDTHIHQVLFDRELKPTATDQERLVSKIRGCRKIWKDCKVYNDEVEAMKQAQLMESQLSVCEYGVCLLKVEAVF